MKFDLFDAMALMKRSFGNAGSIRLSNDISGVVVTLEMYKDGVLYSRSFIISTIQIAQDNDVGLYNLLFEDAIARLKEAAK